MLYAQFSRASQDLTPSRNVRVSTTRASVMPDKKSFVFFSSSLLAINGYHVQVQASFHEQKGPDSQKPPTVMPSLFRRKIKGSMIINASSVFCENHERALNGPRFISGLRGLSGKAKRSSSPSRELGLMGAGSPFITAFRDTDSVRPWGRGIAEKEDTAMSPPSGDNVWDGTSTPVNVFAMATCQHVVFFSSPTMSYMGFRELTDL